MNKYAGREKKGEKEESEQKMGNEEDKLIKAHLNIPYVHPQMQSLVAVEQSIRQRWDQIS